MVFFCCDGCGETLKKNQVDAHAAKCRRCDAVSCVDCSVSFFGDDYRAHTSCMTEAERYEGNLFKAKKKRSPQEDWMDIVSESAETAPAHLKGYLRTMSGLDNIPRKQKQFRNFTGNSLSLRGGNDAVVGELWSLLKAQWDKRQAQKEKERQEQQRERRERLEEVEKTKKAAAAENQEGEKKSDSKDIDSKKVKKAMKKALKKAPNKCMKLKALRKQLETELGLSKNAKKLLKELLKNAPKKNKKDKIVVDGKMISLV